MISWRALSSLLLLTILCACGGIPQPFQGAQRNDAILDTITANRSVMITPIIGPPPPINQKLAQDIAIAAQEKDVVAITRGGDTKTSLLRSQARPVVHDDGSIYIEFTWILTDPAGFNRGSLVTEVAAFSETANDPWLLYANSDLRPMVQKVARFLATELVGPTAALAQPPVLPKTTLAPPPLINAASQKPPPLLNDEQSSYQVYVGEITGAPGDGNTALGDAMRLLLSPGNILMPLELNDKPTDATYIIQGHINRTRLSESLESIQLIWQLTTPNGDILGKVNQENQVSRGSLNGAWGDTALYAVEGAAEGLLRLLLRQPTLAAPLDVISPSQSDLRGSFE